MTALIHHLVESTVDAWVARRARVLDIQSQVIAARRPPHDDVRAHDVVYETADGCVARVRLVTKSAPLAERRLQVWLGERGLPVPFGHSLDLTSDDLAPLCLQDVSDAPVPGSAEEVARSLAAVHAEAMGRASDLTWLPRADSTYFADFTVDRCWRKPWQSTLENGDYVDAYGHRTPPGPPGDFHGTFDRYTQSLEDAAARFLKAMNDLWQEGDSLTLIHADFHDEHVRFHAGRPYLIDWGQARHGPLFVDLPNYFTREDALLYRDALADFGHDVPRDEFLARYDAARPYPGFKYFGVGLWNWRYGTPPHQNAHVQHFVDMVL